MEKWVINQKKKSPSIWTITLPLVPLITYIFEPVFIYIKKKESQNLSLHIPQMSYPQKNNL